ncbi:hypothetical protein BKA01_003356 [Pseudonocardia eucalypti]|uniref:hypothetical protein n=1 Tax=Pseudonocardia eucalypti TaxID=648755 RepID=UPI0018165924|nr:hypothetical protein [Pseudonocardia eucalypti]
MNTAERIEALLGSYDSCDLECDGMTRIFSTILLQHGIPHDPYFGRIIYEPSSVEVVHYWIRLRDGLMVDYRARMWLGDSQDVPHGVFRAEDYEQVRYEGQSIELLPLSDNLFRVLVKL